MVIGKAGADITSDDSTYSKCELTVNLITSTPKSKRISNIEGNVDIVIGNQDSKPSLPVHLQQTYSPSNAHP